MRAAAPSTLPLSTSAKPDPSQQQARTQAENDNYRAALAASPDDAALHYKLAKNLFVLNHYEDAAAAFVRAIELAPTSALLCDYAELLAATQRHEQAIQMYQEALQHDAGNTSAYNSLGLSFQATGQLDKALDAYRQMLARMPDSAIAHNNIGSVLQTQGQLDAALESFQHALVTAPYFQFAHFNVGTCMMRMGRPEEALKSFVETIRLDPGFHLAHINLSAILSKLGHLEESVEMCRRALKINPDWADMHSNLLFSLSHSAQLDTVSLFDEHRLFAKQFETPLRGSWPSHDKARDPERRLRIGFVSGDLNNHAVANFIAPVLEHLVHANGLELLIYCNNLLDDAVTVQLRTLVRDWHDVQQLSDSQLAQKIMDDGIDILIDLSGHTGYNRLLAFARKPAPLQATWIGYPLTTGLEAMDYYLTDRFFSPPGLLDDQFTEKMLRLPATAPFMPSPDAPPISVAPASLNGHITFGSFNRPNKLSDAVIVRWSKLLRALPEAKMVLAGMPSEQISNGLRAAFVKEGINAERLSFYPHTNTRDYLALHSLVDVCLDTSPYAGGTTTFHALWMGVPTLTMTGLTLPSRVGATILEQVGLTEFIAANEDDFLQKGMAIACNTAALATLRASMRKRMNNAPSGQPALIAAGLDDALRSMWKRLCAGQPPASFDAEPANSSLHQRASSLQSLHDVNVDAALLLAIEHHQSSRYAEAETLYLAIIHSQPQHAIANHNMGLLAMQLGFQEEALPYLSAAHDAARKENQFCISYAKCLLHAGKAQQALDIMTTAIAHGGSNAELQALLLQIQAGIAASACNPTQDEANHIVALYQAGQHVELEAAAHALVARYPDSGFAWSVLGTALQVQGKDALDTLQTAVALAPDDAQTQNNLGNAWQGMGQHARAIDFYMNALALNADFPEAYYNLGSAQEALGLVAKAVESYDMALARNPGYTMAQEKRDALLLARPEITSILKII
ncbi:tetratricopeptide repeat protein [Janthinobacterium sp. PSPC1-1]|uniref:O-linked N-acetylglucosamine transferase family protein n=1 Tax=Janthinobacterium sp. PSPC1-1 TaxID=2804581 RepID=UPI003CF04A0C